MRYALIVASVLLSFACSRERGDVSRATPSNSTTIAGGTDTVETNTAVMDPTLPTEQDEPSSRASVAQSPREVHLIEYQIHMPQTLDAGRNVFKIENGGKEKHAFEIEGNGIEKESEVLSRGGSTQLSVDLKPGTYTVYCPVDDHKEKGMRTTVTVR